MVIHQRQNIQISTMVGNEYHLATLYSLSNSTPCIFNYHESKLTFSMTIFSTIKLQCNPYIADTVGTGFIVCYSEVSSLEGWKITVI